MKSTGIVRKVDELGRVVLPIELRRHVGIEIKDPVEIFMDGDYIVLKKHTPECIFCGGTEKVVEIKGTVLCQSCIEKIKGMNLGQLEKEAAAMTEMLGGTGKPNLQKETYLTALEPEDPETSGKKGAKGKRGRKPKNR